MSYILELPCWVSSREEDQEGRSASLYCHETSNLQSCVPGANINLAGLSQEQFDALKPGIEVKLTLEVCE